jgi:hypothetical protein
LQPKAVTWRAALVGGGGILAVLGSQRVGFDGAGPLGCITAAFIASCGWRAENSEATVDFYFLRKFIVFSLFVAKQVAKVEVFVT